MGFLKENNLGNESLFWKPVELWKKNDEEEEVEEVEEEERKEERGVNFLTERMTSLFLTESMPRWC